MEKTFTHKRCPNCTKCYLLTDRSGLDSDHCGYHKDHEQTDNREPVKDVMADLEKHLREIRDKLKSEYESADYPASCLINREIQGLNHALSFIHKNKQ